MKDKNHPEYRRTLTRALKHADTLYGSCEIENEASRAKSKAVSDLKGAIDLLLEQSNEEPT